MWGQGVSHDKYRPPKWSHEPAKIEIQLIILEGCWHV